MNKLAVIAELLRREATIRGIARHPLKNGLHLTLRRDGLDWILSLTRQDVAPSQAEEHTVRRDFGIPESAARSTETKRSYQIIRLRWPAAEQKSFIGPAEPETRYYQE